LQTLSEVSFQHNVLSKNTEKISSDAIYGKVVNCTNKSGKTIEVARPLKENTLS
jgi:hypothetical protein